MVGPITLTDFVDFVSATGRPKLTKVRQIKERGEYDPRKDFWKRLREAIQAMHAGGHDRAFLDRMLAELTDQKKLTRYPVATKGYKRFLGRKTITWFAAPSALWTEGQFSVRVNPELGLCVDGERLAVKLYFKKPTLSMRKTETALYLMHSCLPREPAQSYGVAILDVPNSRLIRYARPDVDLEPLLRGEARGFAAMWEALPD